MQFLTLATWCSLWCLCQSSSSFIVQLPMRHTAMQSDLDVSYSLLASDHLVTAMVHVEYVDKMSVASLPVPMGLNKGTLVVDCNLIKRAGRLRAILTIDGQTMAMSEILNVHWPNLKISVPSSLEMHEADVSINLAFEKQLCNHKKTLFDKKQLWLTPSLTPENELKAGLELRRCSENVEGHCKEDFKEMPLMMEMELRSLYARQSFNLMLNCSVWDAVGLFRVFVVVDNKIVAISPIIRVKENREYDVRNVESGHVLPCLRHDVKPFGVRRPGCAPRRNDALRVYGQGEKEKRTTTSPSLSTSTSTSTSITTSTTSTSTTSTTWMSPLEHEHQHQHRC